MSDSSILPYLLKSVTNTTKRTETRFNFICLSLATAISLSYSNPLRIVKICETH